MKVKLPKDLSGVKFPEVFVIEMNTFDIDHFLPSLFYTILARGRRRHRIANDSENIKGYVEALSVNNALEGFDDPERRRILERLVRTTLITTGKVGLTGKGEQITSIVPYSLLSHKSGFPVKSSRLRGADTFIYEALRDKMQRADDRLQEAIMVIFGRGVIIGNMPGLGGQYDGKTELDTLTRLSIAFLDGFQNTVVRANSNREKNIEPVCPTLANELATDLLRFLFEYYNHMPVQAFTYNLLALINFELFNYALKLVYAVNELVQNSETLPNAMQDILLTSSPQLYLDFTNDARSQSHEMAKACVRRDIEAYQQYLPSILRLRLLNRYVELLSRNPQRRAKIQDILDGVTSGPLYLQRLLQLPDDASLGAFIEAQAGMDEEHIREQNELQDEDVDAQENEENLAWLDEIANTAETSLGRVVNLLVEGQRDNAIGHFISWYYGVGGMKKPHGVLRGNASRQSWRYAPSNDLLATLVQVAAARISQQGVRPIRLQEFLAFLEEHYGILIDRPPDIFNGSEYRAAARDNLRTMLNRLRQMGIFRDLSDDFTVQRLHPPYMDTGVKMEA
ncbi:MAG TPA: hypothetical protein VFQ36_14145 [Ktedonobacteraceae bacterium]|nr:hypothetical protein [Ktedonobacteraceae bacterium]